ncbi:hypothetical protein HYFRA_00014194 [Hymenoscyphus fraxineus]|uniref:Uncharacterized protein n=1 Tax=Hymenoscyphus fraxineus TaxID=746836 RepID=A0A9N9PPW5_9HELO|nr:hypothetical protein HYFRA_00014194 [Hymenoscyphus fraxineus]
MGASREVGDAPMLYSIASTASAKAACVAGRHAHAVLVFPQGIALGDSMDDRALLVKGEAGRDAGSCVASPNSNSSKSDRHANMCKTVHSLARRDHNDYKLQLLSQQAGYGAAVSRPAGADPRLQVHWSNQVTQASAVV